MKIKERIASLRHLMDENHIDAYIIPSSDAHLSEYVANHYKCREWISGFTGSAGTVVITKDDAGLWADGRYYIQAEKQIEGSGIRLFKMAAPGVPTYTKWIFDTLHDGATVGFDGSVFSEDQVKKMEKDFKDKSLKLKIDKDLIGTLWEDRPSIPTDLVFLHDVKFAGKTRKEKMDEVRCEMKKQHSDFFLLTSLDDIAWLLNIRGNDVPNNPVIISNVLLSHDKCILFIDPCKVSPEIKDELKKDNIEIEDYNKTLEYVKKIENTSTTLLDPEKVNALLYSALKSSIVEKPNITNSLKAIKNKTEIENLKECQILDGVAMVKFIKWLKTSLNKTEITELSASNKLEEIRKENKLCIGISFDTIDAYKEHAAMMHYKPTKESSYTLKNEGFFLVDSGGQYYSGTTDITRTFVLGKLTEEEKRDYTLVLKSHIALDSLKFLHGATGSNLDVIARQPVWKYGIDYKCGTGHGVGFFLNVHEGPQRLSQVPNDIVLEEGMILTNEPGIYKEGKHGIRTENMMLVVKDEETEFGQFMKFEAVTYCPIDLAGVNMDMLNEEEKTWLKNYNNMVYHKLSPYLNDEEKAWLKNEIEG